MRIEKTSYFLLLINIFILEQRGKINKERIFYEDFEKRRVKY